MNTVPSLSGQYGISSDVQRISYYYGTQQPTISLKQSAPRFNPHNLFNTMVQKGDNSKNGQIKLLVVKNY
jgi:hypothetical protein